MPDVRISELPAGSDVVNAEIAGVQNGETRRFAASLLTGQTGPQGPAGPQGVQGEQGLPGADGADGLPGADGATGPQGSQGPQGDPGPTGDTGPQGPQGLPGADGATGPEGPQGPAGSQGLPGSPGADGADGQGVPVGGTSGQVLAKASATDFDTEWVSGGGGGADGLGWTGGSYSAATGIVTFTSDDGLGFVTGDLRGADGADGAQGPQGIQGLQGDPGADGADGAPGAQGPQGIQGPAGNDGAPGADGATGPQGIQGIQGETGPTGDTGPQGVQGIQGPAGADGSDGAPGATGPAGADGQGVPTGGTAGQVLEKIDGTDFNTQWATPSGGGGGGTTVTFFQVEDDGTTGQTTTGSFATLAGMWGTPSLTDSDFSWDGATGILTVNQTGTLELDISVMSHQSTGNNRTQLEIRVTKNGTSTVLIAAENYSQRNGTQDKGGCSIPGFKDAATATDTYRIQVRDIGTAVNVGSTFVPGETYISAKLYT